VSPGALAALGDWPQDGLEDVERCPVCGSRSRTLLHDNRTDRSYLSAPGSWRLLRCSGCSSAYLDPRPTEDTVHLAYATYYTGATSKAPANARTGWRSFRRAIRNGYVNSRYGYRLTPASRLGRFVAPLLPRYREEADELVRHLPLPTGQPRLLDVGCGEGDFLAEMQRWGWQAEGLDPSRDAVELARARGIHVTHGTLSEAHLPAGAYDAVTLRLVLEHLHDPVAGVVACREALKPGGVLWIASPSLESEAYRTFGRDWIFLETPRHAVLFAPKSLVNMVAALGFVVTALRPSRQALWSFRMSDSIARGKPPFRQLHRLPVRLALRARLADLKALRRTELADVVVLVARKG
jgi:2-polyprenyl-3-methyl-5-hydroxy-6-metoxy-1,4-benzoquinol methylase